MWLNQLQINIPPIEWLVIIVFVLFFIGAIYMFITFYICDSGTCKAYNQASYKGEPGSKEYTLALLDELFNDGIWPIPFIGAVIIGPLTMYISGMPITFKSFLLSFIISFLVIYFLLSFFGHHYLRPITDTVSEYVENT